MSKQTKEIRRRDFLKVGGAAAAAATAPRVLGPRKAHAEAAPTDVSRAPEFIIDSHYHWKGGEDWVEETVRAFRAHNAMACTLGWMREMEAMVQAREAHPDVFLLYGRVDLDDPNAVREVEAFHDSGFVGMKFHRPSKNWDDPEYFQVYRLCEEFGLHMLFHTGISSRTERDEVPRYGSPARMRPMYLYTIAQQFPRTTVQGAHFGNPWYEEAAEAARWSPNLYFDLTGSTLYKLIHLDQLDKLSEYLWWADWGAEENPHTLQGGPSAWEHIVFGSDEGPAGLEGNIERFQMVMDANNVPEADRAKMWGLTMAEILGVDPETRQLVRRQ